jgi:hypothetical protein
VREQARPVAADLGREPVLAAPAEHVADQCDREELGIGAGRSGTGAARDPQRARLDGVINQAVDVDEQQGNLASAGARSDTPSGAPGGA